MEFDIRYESEGKVPIDKVVDLYASLGWSSAQKPQELEAALQHSHSVITAWHGERLAGLGNAISDGHLVVYYPHLLVHPDYQRRGIGSEIMRRMRERYKDFHQQILVADPKSIAFFEECGFKSAGECRPLWIYEGDDHG